MKIIETYRRVRRNIQQRLYRLKKRGYDTSGIKLPKIPKKITQGSVRKLEKGFSLEKLYEKSSYVRPDTGENVTGKVGRAYERRAAAKRAAETKRQKRKATEPTNVPMVEEKQTGVIVSLDTEYNFMVDHVEQIINTMPDYKIRPFSQACSTAAMRDFQMWLSQNSKEVVVNTLQQWDMSEITKEYYDSDDANTYARHARVFEALASISQTIAENMQELMDADEDNFNEEEINSFL